MVFCREIHSTDKKDARKFATTRNPANATIRNQ